MKKMMDLIERQAAIDEWKNDFKGYVNALNIPRDDYNGIMAYIDELPFAQSESCDDAVSRKDAIIQLSHNKNGDPDCDVIIQHDIETLKQLSPVTPKRTKGKWIMHPEVRNCYGGTYIECSECGEKYMVQHVEDEKFCRNCGADMRGEKDE